MGLIYNKKKIILKVVHQGIWRLARCKPGKVSRVVLDSGTEAGFFHHFYIEVGTLGDTLRFNQLILALEIGNLFFHFFQDRIGCFLDFFLWNNVMGCRENRSMLQFIVDLTCQNIYFCDAVNLISEEFYADRAV